MVPVTVTYLADDPLYKEERPYSVSFPVDDIEGAESTNHRYRVVTLELHDARDRPDLALDTSGFTFVKDHLRHPPLSFESDDFVRLQYFEEVKTLIQRLFPRYRDVLLGDYVLRKRDATFPAQEGARTKYAQPLTLPHLDYTPLSGNQRFGQLSREHGLKDLEGSQFDQLNIWRVLKGPNNDWPLGLCDFRTVERDKDGMVNDVILRDVASENYVLRESEAHRWYYMSDQDVDDVLIFRNTSSPGRESAWAWHAAMDISNHVVSHLRESIEIRVFAFL